MPEYLKSVLVQRQALTVSTSPTPWDLPVNPISHILFTLINDNDTGTLDNYKQLVGILAQITKLEVQYKGQAIISLNGADLAMYSMLVRQKPLGQVNMLNVTNKMRSLTIPIPFGRRSYDPNECFPATRKGELKLAIDVGAAVTGIDALNVSIETVELPEAAPTQFLKCTTMSKTPTATGEHDVDLPLGNRIMGIMMFATEAIVETIGSETPDIGDVKLLRDNKEQFIAKTNWETLHNEMLSDRFPSSGIYNQEHVHLSGAATPTDSDAGQRSGNFPENYIYLDFDPLNDDQYLLETEGAGRLWLRINAEEVTAIRIMPIELMGIG
jgi:hypothetical protein